MTAEFHVQPAKYKCVVVVIGVKKYLIFGEFGLLVTLPILARIATCATREPASERSDPMRPR